MEILLSLVLVEILIAGALGLWHLTRYSHKIYKQAKLKQRLIPISSPQDLQILNDALKHGYPLPEHWQESPPEVEDTDNG